MRIYCVNANYDNVNDFENRSLLLIKNTMGILAKYEPIKIIL